VLQGLAEVFDPALRASHRKEELFQELVRRTVRLASKHKFWFYHSLYSIDTTTIALCLSVTALPAESQRAHSGFRSHQRREDARCESSQGVFQIESSARTVMTQRRPLLHTKAVESRFSMKKLCIHEKLIYTQSD
jgi:hypothetical protein